MKKIILVCVFILGSVAVSNAQLNQLDAEAFFKPYTFTELNVIIYCNLVSGNSEYKWFSRKSEIKPGANSVVFGERSMTIKASDGNVYLIVYDKIKTLEYYKDSKSIAIELVQ